MGHGKNLKSRRKKVSRVSRPRNRTKISHPQIQSQWERGNLNKNYQFIGLATDANKAVVKPVEKEVKKPQLLNEWKHIDNEETIHRVGVNAVKRPPNYMSEELCLELKPLVGKYGDDFDAMFKDIKLNKWQRTKGWLKRNVTRYNKYMASNDS
mmetsp:Transcript_1620/g.2527  ORF Transcript_1620/g.2527 Transcript_1620/m.2527 type:complete len:153 (+) Transcript_1620:380-838(+)